MILNFNKTSTRIILGVVLMAIVFIASEISVAANSQQGRPRISLCGEWKYQILERLDQKPSDSWLKTTLPNRKHFKIGGKKNAAMFEKIISIPEQWRKDRLTVINIGQAFFGTIVYVNGKKAGEIPAYGGGVDISPYIKYGKDNTIRLVLPKLGKGLEKIDAVTKALANRMEHHTGPKLGLLGYYSSVGINCMEKEFYLENQPLDILIEDVWFRTYTRGGKRIEPRITLKTSKNYRKLTAEATICDYKTGKEVLRKRFVLNNVDGNNNTHDLLINAEDLQTWNLRAPYLYMGQIVIYDERNKQLDASTPVRFGVREFWVQGKYFYMNGCRVNFIWDRTWSRYKNLEELFASGANYTLGRNWAGEYLFVDWKSRAVKADELGLGLSQPGIVCKFLNLKDPAIMSSYKTWVRQHLRRNRNHPSILMWGLETNILTGPDSSFLPTKLGRSEQTIWTHAGVSRATIIHKEMDPTRCTYVHGGMNAPGIPHGNIFFNHLPTQEIEDWPSEWVEKGDHPFMVAEFLGTPLEHDFLRGGCSYATEYVARMLGDVAYKDESIEYLTYANYTTPRLNRGWSYTAMTSPHVSKIMIEGHERSAREWRFARIPIMDWIKCSMTRPVHKGMKDFWNAHLKSQKPIKAWIGGPAKNHTAKDHNFFSGDRIEKSLVALRDITGSDRWRVNWQVVGQNKTVVDRGSFMQMAGPYSRIITPFHFVAPDVKKPTCLTLDMEVTNSKSKKIIDRDSFEMTIFPNEWPPRKKVVQGKAFAVIDTDGDTKKWLRQLGVKTVDYKSAKNNKGVIVVGRRGLKSMQKKLPFTENDIAQGLRVVILEQHCKDLGRMGFRHEDRAPRQTFIRQPGHILMRGLDNKAMRNWRGAGTLISKGPERNRVSATRRLGHWGNRGTVASVIIETPHYGPFKPVVDCEFDLAYSPLLSWRHGKGEILFCQLDLTGRIGKDPAATAIGKNLVDYLSRPIKGNPQNKSLITLTPELALSVEKQGFTAKHAEKNWNVNNHVVMVDAKDVKLFARRRREVVDFAAKGGDVLILNADGKFLADAIFSSHVKADEKIVSRAERRVEKHELLNGVGPQNIHWREHIKLNALTAKSPSFSPLLGGFAGVMKHNKGRFVFLQVDPKANEDYTATENMDITVKKKKPISKEWRYKNRLRGKWNMLKLRSLVLANLGIKSSPQLVEQLFELKPQKAPQTSVNYWTYLGPFVPSGDIKADPLSLDLERYIASRDIKKTFINKEKETVRWYFPNDSQNGLGTGGRMDLFRVYGVRLKYTVFAVTQIYSSRKRQATIKFGADWWATVKINGKEVFRTVPGKFGYGFGQTISCELKKGWNDVVVRVASGSSGNCLNFTISNPGDLVVEQSTTTPDYIPENLPPLDKLLPDHVKPGYSFYCEDINEGIDPYLYIRW